MEPELIIAKPAELILKSSAIRARFETQLIKNIKAALKENNINYDHISRLQSRILIYTDEIEEALTTLKRIFGIVVLSPAVEIGTDLEAIKRTALDMAKQSGLKRNKTFAVQTKRVTKEFKLTSPEINQIVGEFIQKKIKSKVNFKQPDIRIYIELIGKRTFIFTKIIRAYGGLPVGTQGKVVCLMSGGLDSPVAAWMMLKRGCEIIPLHMRISEREHQKFLQLCKQLQKFSAGHKIKPHSINWRPFLEKLTRKLKKLKKISWTCIFCKHQMLLEAQKLAKKEGANAICIGSSLGQVASQTIENIAVSHYGIDVPILTPLIGLNKDEIEKIAKEIGTYEISSKGAGAVICPFVPSKPVTKTSLKKFKELKRKISNIFKPT